MKRDFFLYALPSVIIGGLGALVLIPITTYYLDPDDFGVFGLLTAFTMPLGPLASVGVSWVLAGNYFRVEEKERKEMMFNVLSFELVLKLFWIILFWFLAPYLLPMLAKDFQPEYLTYFRMLLLSLLFGTLSPSVAQLLILQKKPALYAFFEIGAWVLGSLATIAALAYFKLSTVSLFWGQLVNEFISLLLAGWYVKDFLIPRFQKHWFLETVKVGLPSIPWNLTEVLRNVLDRYFIQLWHTLADVGVYIHSLTYKAVFGIGSKAFNNTFNADVLELFSQGFPLQDFIGKLKKWYGILGIGGTFFIFFSHEIVDILTHGKFLAAAPLIPLWFLFPLFFSFGMPYTQYLLVHKKNFFLSVSGILVTAISIVLMIFAIRSFGIMGATIAVVASNGAVQLVRFFYARKLGCHSIADRTFFGILIFLISLYIFNNLISFGILEKMGIFAILTASIVYYFKLLRRS